MEYPVETMGPAQNLRWVLYTSRKPDLVNPYGPTTTPATERTTHVLSRLPCNPSCPPASPRPSLSPTLVGPSPPLARPRCHFVGIWYSEEAGKSFLTVCLMSLSRFLSLHSLVLMLKQPLQASQTTEKMTPLPGGKRPGLRWDNHPRSRRKAFIPL